VSLSPVLSSFPTRRSSDLYRGAAATHKLFRYINLLQPFEIQQPYVDIDRCSRETFRRKRPSQFLDVGRGHLRDKDNHQANVEPRSEEHTSELQSRENLVCR